VRYRKSLWRSRRSRAAAWLGPWLALLAGPTAFAGVGVWTPIGPAVTSTVFSLAADPDQPRTLYAALYAGVYRSTDGGNSWTAAGGAGGTPPGLHSLVFGTDGALYGGAPGAPWRSVDGGATWQNLAPAGGFLPTSQLAFDPRDPLTIYVAAYQSGSFRSTDGGATWNAINQGLEPAPPAYQPNVFTIAVSPRHRNLLLAGTDQGIFRSADGGASWQRVTASCNGTALLFDPLRPARVYAGCSIYVTSARIPVMVSLDSGLSWQPASSGLPHKAVNALAALPGVPRAVFAGTSTGVFRSTDAGGHWTPSAPITTPTGVPAAVFALAFLSTPAPVLYAGTDSAGVSSSGDLGTSWTPLSRGLPGGPVNVVASDPAGAGRLYVATADGNGILRIRNGGATWVPINRGLTDLALDTLAVATTAPPTLYALDFGNDLFVSTNAGRRWTRNPLPPAAQQQGLGGLAVVPEQPEHILLGAGSSLFQSHDGGATWDAGTLVIPDDDSLLLSAAVAPSAPATIYAGGMLTLLIPFTSTFEAWKSTDGGATWSAIGFPDGHVSALAVDPADADTAYACGGLFGDFLARTVDGGATWTQTAAGGSAVATATKLPGFVAAGGTGVPHPVAVSQDRGATWTFLDAGLPPQVVVQSLAVDPASTASQVTLYAGTESGVFEITLAPKSLGR
jgi:photosystem II stability/assembly factor-like uncharacterized protein